MWNASGANGGYSPYFTSDYYNMWQGDAAQGTDNGDLAWYYAMQHNSSASPHEESCTHWFPWPASAQHAPGFDMFTPPEENRLARGQDVRKSQPEQKRYASSNKPSKINVELNQQIIAAGKAEALVGICAKRLSEFNMVNTITALHRLAKSGPHSDVKRGRGAKVLDDLIQKAQRMLEDPAVVKKPREVANAVWAVATLQLNTQSAILTLDKAAQEVAKQAPNFNAQALANTTWAFGRTLVKRADTMEAIMTEVALRTDEFSEQALTNTLWGFATLSVDNEGPIYAILGEAHKRIHSFGAQELANTSWALARMFLERNPMQTQMLHAIASKTCTLTRDFTPQGLSNIAWAFARISFRQHELTKALAHEGNLRVHELNPQDLASLAWSFTTLSWRRNKVLDSISSEVLQKISEIDRQQLAILVGINLPCHDVLDHRQQMIISVENMLEGGDMEDSKTWDLAD